MSSPWVPALAISNISWKPARIISFIAASKTSRYDLKMTGASIRSQEHALDSSTQKSNKETFVGGQTFRVGICRLRVEGRETEFHDALL
jgi:hypothetical protein